MVNIIYLPLLEEQNTQPSFSASPAKAANAADASCQFLTFWKLSVSQQLDCLLIYFLSKAKETVKCLL